MSESKDRSFDDTHDAAAFAEFTREATGRPPKHTGPLGTGGDPATANAPGRDRGNQEAGGSDLPTADALERFLKTTLAPMGADDALKSSMRHVGLSVGSFYLGALESGATPPLAIHFATAMVYALVARPMQP